MANEIDLVVGTQVKAQLDALIAHLAIVDAKLVETSQLAITLGKQVPKITTPSGGSSNAGANAGANKGLVEASVLNKKLADQIDLLRLKITELQKARAGGTITLLQETVALKEELRVATAAAKGIDLNAIATKKLEAEKKKLEAQTNRTNAATERATTAANKAAAAAEKQGLKEAAAAEKASSAYNRTQAQLNKLTAVYNDLSVRKERYNNLSKHEEARLVTLTRVNEKYNGVLRTTDAAIGKNTRNVGNYASGWNGLSNSINQLTREAPAFANSMQTGFMAISNNIPILVDEIVNLKKANLDLVASGGKAKSIFKSVAGALFSWQTLISVGVTLLTMYGAKLYDMAMGLGDVEKALKSLDRQQKLMDNSMSNVTRNIEHQTQLEKDRAKIKGATQDELNAIDLKGAKAILKNLETVRNANLANFKLAQEGRTAEGKAKLKDSGMELSRLVGERIKLVNTKKGWGDEEAKRLADIDIKIRTLRDLNIKKNDRVSDEIFNKLKNNYTESENAVILHGQKITELESANRVASYEASKKIDSKENELILANLAQMNRKELELQLAKIDQFLNNEDNYYSDRLNYLEKDFLVRSKIAELDRDEELRLADGDFTLRKTATLNFYIEQIKLLEAYNKEKKGLEKLSLKPVTELATSDLEDKDPMKTLHKNAVRGLKSLKGTTENLKSTWKDTFNSIAESAQRAGDIMADFSDRNFANEYSRLEAQKDIALKFAGDSASAKQKIEEDYEKRHKDIANRENKAKQKQAIFNIAIDTAQAIMATVGKTGFAGLPLALILGALGAAQIAMVATQKIPQYFEGGTHDGGLMMVNDAKGSNYKETIVTPDGKIIKPEGRDVLMNAPKGTQIFTPEQWQEKELHGMLQSKGISMNESYHNNSGLTYQEMDAILGKHFKNITTQTTTFDKKGFSSYSVSKGNKTIRNENRASGQGFKV